MNHDLRSLIAAADTAAKDLSRAITESTAGLSAPHAVLHNLQMAVDEFLNRLSGAKSQL